MQQAGDADLAAAVLSASRRPVWDVRADWRRTGTTTGIGDLTPVVASVSTERSLTGTLPAEAGLVEGFGTASLSATLAGSAGAWGRGAAVELSPFRTGTTLAGAPVEGAPITCQIGLATTAGTRLVPQFTGTVRRITPRSSSRTVGIEALDRSDTLRAPITLPTWGLPRSPIPPQTTDLAHRINSQWVLDFILRRNSIFASPPPDSRSFLVAGMHGGFAPEVGFEGSVDQVAPYGGPAWVTGAHGLLSPRSVLAETKAIRYTTAPTYPGFALKAGAGVGMSAWIDAGGMGPTQYSNILSVVSTPELQPTREVILRVLKTSPTAARLVVEINRANTRSAVGSPNFDPGRGPRHVGVHVLFRSDLTVTVTWRIDGATSTSTLSGVDMGTVTHATTPTITVRLDGCVVTDLNVRSDPNTPGWWIGETHTPQASLDAGLGELTALPVVVEQESLPLISAIVAAELGAFFFDENGFPSFLNRSTIATRMNGAPVRAFTADRSLIDMGVERNVDSVRNTVVTRATPRRWDNAAVAIYRSATPAEFAVGQYSTSTFTVPIEPGAYSIARRLDGSITVMAASGWAPSSTPHPFYGISSQCAVRSANGPDANAANVTVTAHQVTPTALVIQVVNNNAYGISFVDGSGAPAFWVQGQRVTDDDAEQTSTRSDPLSVQTYGPRTLDLPSGPWRQWLPAMVGVGDALLAELRWPSAVLEDIPVVGDPRTQLADVVTVSDPAGLGSVTGGVVKITRSVDASSGLRDLITLRYRTP